MRDAMLARARQWIVVLLFLPLVAQAAVPAAGAAIASAHPLATEAGQEVLRAGGNAFDAAVAISAALGVVEPYASGLGGGGFFLLHRAADRFETMIDARETAPRRASPGMFLDAQGRVTEGASTFGGLAAGIPGLPAGLVHLSQTYGRLPLARSLEPAIRLARGGFAVDRRYALVAGIRERQLREGSGTAAVYLDRGTVPGPGYVLKQPDLARTLETLGRHGRDGFYRGSVARALVAAVNERNGIWDLQDLEGYRVIEREPIRIRHRGAVVTSAPPPSSGGVTLALALNILESRGPVDPSDPAGAHLVIEAMRRAYEDRNLHLGDPDHVRIPVERLLDKAYAARRSADIDARAASRAAATDRGPVSGGTDTTHFSIVDAEGNRVAATLSINTLFGACVVAAGTGILLNNEMDDFTLHEGLANAYRLRQGAANAIAPGKRPLSSMSPTFVEDARGVLVLGSPGGSRIISQVLVAILDHLARPAADLARTVAAPRFHHQHWPDEVEVEPVGLPPAWLAGIEARGHRLRRVSRQWGNMQAVFRDSRSGAASAASDPRGGGVAWY